MVMNDHVESVPPSVDRKTTLDPPAGEMSDRTMLLCGMLSRDTAWVLLRGQLISVLIAGTGIFATILSNSHPNANFPLLMNLFNYVLLALFMFRRRIVAWWRGGDEDKTIQWQLSLDDSPDDHHRSSKSSSLGALPMVRDLPLAPSETQSSLSIPARLLRLIHGEEQNGVRVSKLLYLFAAVLDVEANFLVLLAYNYTSITSVMMLDCFTIPCAMGLSYVFLGCRYTWKHITGTAICLIGLACIVLNDTLQDHGESSENQHHLLGDVLCLSSAVLYASSNVIQETVVKFHDRDQYLGHMGLFGSVIALAQFLATDAQRVHEAHFTPEIVLSMAGFVLCLFFIYVNTTAYLKESDATLFNLSLLTSDVYAVIFSFFFYGSLVSWLYFLAFALVIAGLFLYHSETAPLQVGEGEGSRWHARAILTFGSWLGDVDDDTEDQSRHNSSQHNGQHRPQVVGVSQTRDGYGRVQSGDSRGSGSSGNRGAGFSYNPIMDDSIDRAVIG